jgi:hypothetical protein
MIKESTKAEEIYIRAVSLHGIARAKEEAIKSAEAVYALAPSRDGRMMARDYWERVIEYLKAKK